AANEAAKLNEEALRIEDHTEQVKDLLAPYQAWVDSMEKLTEAFEKLNEAMDPVLDAINDAQFEIETAGMTEAEKQLQRIRDQIIAANGAAGVYGEHSPGLLTPTQEANLAELDALQQQLAILRQQQKIREEMRDAQKEA